MSKVISSLFNNQTFYDQIFKPQIKHIAKTFKPGEKIIEQVKQYP